MGIEGNFGDRYKIFMTEFKWYKLTSNVGNFEGVNEFLD